MLNFTSAQIHLARNHLPVFGALFATGILVVAGLTRQASARNLGLGLLVFAAVSALPVYWSGEGTEEIVEDRPGISESLIEDHEKAAERALAVTLVAGLVGAAALLAVRLRRQRAAKTLFAAALLSSLATTGLLGQVAHLGGQIRHDEIRAGRGSAQEARRAHHDTRLHHDDD